MGRQARGPRYWPTRKGYYVNFHGVRHCLAAGEICSNCQQRERDGSIPSCERCKALRYAADLRFAQIRNDADVDAAKDTALLNVVLNRYIAKHLPKKKPGTQSIVKRGFASFNVDHGHMQVKDLKPHHVDTWLDSMTTRGNSTRRMYFASINGALNWAATKGLIEKNPVASGVDVPANAAGRKRRLSLQRNMPP